MTKSRTPLQVKDLFKDYNGRPVLSGVCLTVGRSECVVLTGANGAGKTTLLRCLAGAVRPSAGEVLWYQRPVRSDPLSMRQIGFVAHEPRLYAHLTLRENLIFAARMTDVRNPRQRADQLLNGIGLTEYSKSLPTSLSRGMRQHTAIARALIHDPQIVMLDEPFAGLDGEGSRWLIDRIDDLRGLGGCCCVATHDLELCSRLGGRDVRLQAGRLERQAEQTCSPSAA